MITPSFALTATERVLPRLALDFTTASLDARVTFTRTTGASNPATYVDSNGYVVAATNNQPRFDYGPVTLACKGLLIEESRTNQKTYSEDYSTWTTKTNTSVAPATVTSPSGAPSVSNLVEASGAFASFSIANSISSVTASTTYTYSHYVKTAGRNFIALQFNAGFSGSPYVCFNLSNGTVGTKSAAITASITDAGGGWFRIVASTAATSSTTGVASLYLCNADNSFGYTGDGTSGVYLWGAQLEAGAFATSYIPTTTTALTRNADVATMTGTNFSDWFTQNNGSFTTEYIRYTGSGVGLSRNILSVSDGTNNNRIELNMANATNDGCYIVTGGSPQAQIVGGTALFNQIARMAVGFQENNTSVAVNGANSVTDTSVLIPTVDRMNIGRSGGGSGGFYNGWIRKIYFYPQRLINLELQSFSK